MERSLSASSALKSDPLKLRLFMSLHARPFGRNLQLKIEAEQAVIAQCRVEPQRCSSTAAPQFMAIVDEGERYEGGRIRFK